MNDRSTLNSSPGGRRQLWLDVARTVAIVSITMNHAISRSFETHTNTLLEFAQISTAASFLKAFIYVFSRLGVPLFLMISGSLLLKRDYTEKETTRRFLKHNWWELFRTTEIWLVIMFWFLQFGHDSILRTEGIGRTLMEFIGTVFFINQTTMASMWYMPMLLMVYLMIPIMAIALDKIESKLFYALFAVAAFIGMIIPNINTILEATGSNITLDFAFDISDLFSVYLLYVLAGFWISRDKLKSIKNGWIYSGFLCSFMLTVVFQFWVYSTPSDYYVRYFDIGVLVSGALLFEIIRRTSEKLRKAERFFTYISKISFGIYFLHICIMTGMTSFLVRYSSIVHYHRFLILEISAFLGSVLIIWITSKSRYIRKYLYLIKE